MDRLGISFPFMIAPMVGLSHVAFRELVRSYLPEGVQGLLFTEMLSTRRLPSEHLDRSETLRCAEGESFFVPQLLGNEEHFIALSIQKLLTAGPWGFDINMGCPVNRILKHNWGVLLMGDPDYAASVVAAARRHSPLPLSVKMRAGTGSTADLDYLLTFTEKLEGAGADWITLHGRVQGKHHKGRADWQIVAEVASRRNIPVVVNGDIQTAADALHVVQELGGDGAMIGRAASARPWILWQIAHRLQMCVEPPPQTLEEESREYFNACLRFIDLLEKYYGDIPSALKRFHFFVITGSHWFFFGHTFWKFTMKAKNLGEARTKVEEYRMRFEHPMVERVTFQ